MIGLGSDKKGAIELLLDDRAAFCVRSGEVHQKRSLIFRDEILLFLAKLYWCGYFSGGIWMTHVEFCFFAKLHWWWVLFWRERITHVVATIATSNSPKLELRQQLIPKTAANVNYFNLQQSEGIIARNFDFLANLFFLRFQEKKRILNNWFELCSRAYKS